MSETASQRRLREIVRDLSQANIDDSTVISSLKYRAMEAMRMHGMTKNKALSKARGSAHTELRARLDQYYATIAPLLRRFLDKNPDAQLKDVMKMLEDRGIKAPSGGTRWHYRTVNQAIDYLSKC